MQDAPKEAPEAKVGTKGRTLMQQLLMDFFRFTVYTLINSYTFLV